MWKKWRKWQTSHRWRAAGLGLIIIWLIYILFTLPNPAKLTSDQFPVSTRILDRNSKLLYEIYVDQNRTPIKLDDLPPHIGQATVAIEDKNFYRHRGFALEGLTRAFLNTVFKRNLQGGSTIIQQLVKTALLSPERTITRKLREAILTVVTEIRFSKKQILEMYLNHIPYGGTAYGIEQASQTYFAKPAKDLSLAEAALLAGLPQAPSRFSPFGANPELAKTRQQQVLSRMLQDKYINQAQYDEALNQELKFAPANEGLKATHFSLHIKELLVDKYGQAMVEKGGLIVTTSLDLDLQEYAENIAASETAKLAKAKVSNAAALITMPRTGEILAMVGSKDYFDTGIDGNVNVTTRPRQPGSSIKPINYAAGLGLGYSPSTLFLDVPVCFLVAGQKPYCPQNYDGKFHGPVQLRFSLCNSFNIPAVKMLAANSVETMIATASAMGISTFTDPARYGLSLTLGGGEVKMTDMAVAFGVFANSGLKVHLTAILKVETYQGKVLEQVDFNQELPVGEEVLAPEIAYLVSHMLLDNNARSQMFGSGSQLVIPGHAVSVKTGTTDDWLDNWTIGYTPSLLAAVWVGNNDNTPMSQSLVSGVSGAAPIWHKIISYALKDKPDEWPKMPENIVGLTVCSLSGFQPNPEHPCDHTRFEYFIKGHEPTLEPNLKQSIIIDKTTGLPPPPNANPDPNNLEPQEHIVLSDPVQQNYCLDCPRPLDDKGQPVEPAYNITIK